MIPRLGHSDGAPTPQLVESPLHGGYDVRLRLTDVSMKPLVLPGRAIVGDIVFTTRQVGMLVSHSLTTLDGEQVWTRGDSVGKPDAPSGRERLLGCAVALETPLGIVLRNPLARRAGRLPRAFVYAGLGLAGHLLLHPRVSCARPLRPESLLSPSNGAVLGTPIGRLAWVEGLVEGWKLARMIRRARRGEGISAYLSRASHFFGIMWLRHFRQRTTRPRLLTRFTKASLEEVRHV